jgi:hypothetical protein
MSDFYGPEDGAGTGKDSVDANTVDVTKLSPDDLRAIEEKAEALRALLDSKDLAKFKIEVMFDKRKTSRGGAYPGGLVVWRSGSAMSGGGDDILYPCPDDKCRGYIGAECLVPSTRTAFCKTCNRAWKQSELHEIRLFKLDADKWAFVLAREFLRTGCLADVYMKIVGSDIRHRPAEETMPSGEQLASTRGNRDYVMYTLKNIVQDVNAGSSIEARMKALLTA